MATKVRLNSLVMDSITDGLGVNLVLVFQGCRANCPGCHNPHTHDEKAGEEFDIESLFSRYTTEITTGVTLSGGEPLLQPDAIREASRIAHARGYKVTLYTGFIEDKFKEALPDYAELLDYVKCGPYVDSLRSSKCPLYGSSNQHFYVVKKTGELVEVFSDTDARKVESE